jgi:hypothetical protein
MLTDSSVRDVSSKGRIVQGTLRPRGGKSGDTPVGDEIKLHREEVEGIKPAVKVVSCN